MDTAIFAENRTMRAIDSWDQEWDRMGHTESELRKEIADLRARIAGYVNQIDDLTMELRAAQADAMMAQDELKRLREKAKARRDG